MTADCFGKAAAVFVGTLPLLAAIGWRLLDQRGRFLRLEGKVDEIIQHLGSIQERLTKIERSRVVAG